MDDCLYEIPALIGYEAVYCGTLKKSHLAFIQILQKNI